MRRLSIAGIIAALALAGCSDDSGVQEGPLPFKSGNVEQLGQMKNQMGDILKNKAHTKRPLAEEKPAEKKQ
jgi:hypothetical protein